MTRSGSATFVVAASLAVLSLSGCASEESSPLSAGVREPVRVCHGLDVATLSEIVGEPVSLKGEPYNKCQVQTERTPRLVLSVKPFLETVPPADLADRMDADETAVVAPIDVEGADEALLVEDGVQGVELRVGARVGSVTYVVDPTAPTREEELRLARATLTVLAGGEVSGDDLVPPPPAVDPCDLITRAEAAAELGPDVRTESLGLRDCFYAADGVRITLGHGYPTRIAAALPILESAGAVRVTVSAPAMDEVYLLRSAQGDEAYVLAAVDATPIAMTVRRADGGDPVELARRLLAAM